MNETLAKAVKITLLCLGVICTGLLLYELNRDYSLDSSELATNTDEPDTQETEQLRELLAQSEYTEIIERPLFMADRRPFVPDTSVAEEEIQQRQRPVRARDNSNQEYLLSAVIITEDKRIALLSSRQNRKLQKVALGDKIDGWTMTDIQSRQVSLTRGTEVKVLELLVKKSPATTRQPGQRNSTISARQNKHNPSSAGVQVSNVPPTVQKTPNLTTTQPSKP